MNIPLSPCEMLDKNMFLNMHRQQSSIRFSNETTDRAKLESCRATDGTSPDTGQINQQYLESCKKTGDCCRHQYHSLACNKSKNNHTTNGKRQAVQPPVRNQNVILPIQIQRAQSELQTNGIESSICSETFPFWIYPSSSTRQWIPSWTNTHRTRCLEQQFPTPPTSTGTTS